MWRLYIVIFSVFILICQSGGCSPLTKNIEVNNSPGEGAALAEAKGQDTKGEEQEILVIEQSLSSTLDTLVQQLEDEDVMLRVQAQDALVRMGKSAVPTMIKLLEGQSLELREAAADVLLEMGPEAEEAIPTLIDAIYDKDETMRRAAAFALVGIGRASAIPTLVKALKNNKVGVRITGAEALNVMGAEAQVASQALHVALHDENYKVRIYAAATILSFDPSHEEAFLVISRALQLNDANVRAFSAMAISSAEVRSHALAPPLLECARDDNGTVRYFALEALGVIGNDSPETVEFLIEGIKNEDIGIGEKTSMAGALVNIGKPVVPLVIKLLDNPNDDVRSLALRVLGNIGPEADEAIPFLLNKIKDRDKMIALAAGQALAHIGGKDVVLALTALLEDSEDYVRYYAANTLGYMGPDASEALPSLLKCLEDEEARVRASAAIAIGSIEIYDARIIKELEERKINDENANVRHWAGEAIRWLNVAKKRERGVVHLMSFSGLKESYNLNQQPIVDFWVHNDTNDFLNFSCSLLQKIEDRWHVVYSSIEEKTAKTIKVYMVEPRSSYRFSWDHRKLERDFPSSYNTGVFRFRVKAFKESGDNIEKIFSQEFRVVGKTRGIGDQ
jgi:HEAT repeat protein